MKETVRNKIKWLIPEEEVEQGAIEQIYNVAQMDIVKKMAIMPDVHQGYDMPIGGVALLDNHISPSFVGYDIGCGMCYVDTGLPVEDMFPDEREKVRIFDTIYDRVPMGVGGGHDAPQEYLGFKTASGNKELQKIVDAKIMSQLGSLGSGNHFIEIGKTTSGTVSITIHSGSRGAGWQTARYYMKMSKDSDGILNLDSDLGQAYLEDMNFFLKYALANRSAIMKSILNIFGEDWDKFKDRMINKTHNHAEITEDGVLHRKGATSSYKDELGVIPGNMRDGAWVVRGLGNDEYLNSSSHGAGRTMSRTKAKQVTSMDKFIKSMDGIVAKIHKKTLDESPYAYKDIETVISRQEGVVIDVIDIAKPIINIKA